MLVDVKSASGGTLPAGWVMSDWLEPRSTLTIGEASMLASTGSIPPTCAKSGVPSWPRMPMSMLRAERAGPMSETFWHWKTAAYRVMPPSTGSSKTMSAWSSPAWGRPSG